MAKADSTPAGGKKGGGLMMGVIVPVLVLTVVAGAGGWLIGTQITAAKSAVAPAPIATEKAEVATTAVRELQPIVTNLAAPDGAWVRLQAAIVYDKVDQPKIDIMASKVVDDTMAFLKTLTVAQLQGATGLQHLREDLNERAGLRSDGHVKELMIEMLVIE